MASQLSPERNKIVPSNIKKNKTLNTVTLSSRPIFFADLLKVFWNELSFFFRTYRKSSPRAEIPFLQMERRDQKLLFCQESRNCPIQLQIKTSNKESLNKLLRIRFLKNNICYPSIGNDSVDYYDWRNDSGFDAWLWCSLNTATNVLRHTAWNQYRVSKSENCRRKISLPDSRVKIIRKVQTNGKN